MIFISLYPFYRLISGVVTDRGCFFRSKRCLLKISVGEFSFVLYSVESDCLSLVRHVLMKSAVTILHLLYIYFLDTYIVIVSSTVISSFWCYSCYYLIIISLYAWLSSVAISLFFFNDWFHCFYVRYHLAAWYTSGEQKYNVRAHTNNGGETMDYFNCCRENKNSVKSLDIWIFVRIHFNLQVKFRLEYFCTCTLFL